MVELWGGWGQSQSLRDTERLKRTREGPSGHCRIGMMAAGLPGGSTGRTWLLPTPLCLGFPYTSSTQHTTGGFVAHRSELPIREHPPYPSDHPIPTPVLSPPPPQQLPQCRPLRSACASLIRPYGTQPFNLRPYGARTKPSQIHPGDPPRLPLHCAPPEHPHSAKQPNPHPHIPPPSQGMLCPTAALPTPPSAPQFPPTSGPSDGSRQVGARSCLPCQPRQLSPGINTAM